MLLPSSTVTCSLRFEARQSRDIGRCQASEAESGPSGVPPGTPQGLGVMTDGIGTQGSLSGLESIFVFRFPTGTRFGGQIGGSGGVQNSSTLLMYIVP